MIFRTCIHSNGAVTADLSSEDLLSCCGYVCGNGCNGGFPQAAWEYWVQNGLVTGGLYGGEGCQPYVIEPCEHHTEGDRPACTGEEGTTPRCVHHCQDSYGVDFIQDKHYGSTAYRLIVHFIPIFNFLLAWISIEAHNELKLRNSFRLPSDEEAIMEEIYTNGPVEGAFVVYEDFPTYKSGVYSHHTGEALGGKTV